MPIGFRDPEGLAEIGSAAYFRILRQPGTNRFLAALLCVNARGEPVEFVYNSMEIRHSFLWRKGDAQRFAARQLLRTLFEGCSVSPLLLLCLREETDGRLFAEDMHPSVPVCLVGGEDAADAPAQGGGPGAGACPGIWIPHAPDGASPAGALAAALASRGLLNEPFERVTIGLKEAFALPDLDG